MKTKIITIENINNDRSQIQEAAMILQNGGIVAFPTETVYGLGADVYNPKAIQKIYQAKGRPGDNPLIVHIHNIDQMAMLAKNIPPEAYDLAKAFWPGPLTLILEASDNVPEAVTAGLTTVALRMPSNPVALKLLETAGVPIAAPSANLSGRPSPTRAEHVIEDLNGKAEAIIISEKSKIGIESTVLDLSVKPARILRPGSVSRKELHIYLAVGEEEQDSAIHPKSPGNKYRHYAPKGDFFMITGSNREKAEKTEKILSEPADSEIRIMMTKELQKELSPDKQKHTSLLVIGSIKDPEHIIADFYSHLRDLDQQHIQTIYIEQIPDALIGRAFVNRVEKATGGKTI